jgi:hypothetical protein
MISNLTLGGTLVAWSAHHTRGEVETCKTGCTGLTSTPSTFQPLASNHVQTPMALNPPTTDSGWASPSARQ